MQRTLILLGLALALAGVCWPWLARLRLGHPPGDLVFTRGGWRIYFPIVTMLIVSLVLTLIMRIFRR
jgi:membrane protein implicated in regulation of membrane protease activity